MFYKEFLCFGTMDLLSPKDMWMTLIPRSNCSYAIHIFSLSFLQFECIQLFLGAFSIPAESPDSKEDE